MSFFGRLRMILSNVEGSNTTNNSIKPFVILVSPAQRGASRISKRLETLDKPE